jgi:hypothetical protein
VARTRLLRCSATLLLLLGTALTAGLLLAAVDAALFHPLSRVADLLLVAVGGGVGVSALLVFAASVVRQARAHRSARPRVAALEIRPGVVEDAVPRAFCVGVFRPRVIVTTGALETLTAAEVAAVMAHEQAHVRRHDALRLLLVRALADGLFFCPGARQLAARLATLAELQADEAADRSGLAGAMLRIDGVSAERIDRLLGQRVRWRIDAAVLARGAMVAIALALAVFELGSATGCARHPFVADGIVHEDAPLGALLLTAGAAVLLISRRTLVGSLRAR